MNETIAWINDRWGQPTELSLPLSDRGLQLGDGVFETVLVRNGQPQLLQAHHQRWCDGATVLGMAPPPTLEVLRPLIAEAVQRSCSDGALRLNWSRDGAGARGIQVPLDEPDPSEHRFWFSLGPHTPTFNTESTWISRHERRNANSRLSHCKTFAYGQAIQARQEAILAGADEGLLLSTTGELCCGSTANLLVLRQGQWLTPPLSSGCLPGVMRQQLLELGIAREQHIDPTPQPGDKWLLINSLDCRVVSEVNHQALSTAVEAKELWAELLTTDH
ncbi:aminotransferase class IV [Synechococcus sp. MIT S9451]|uniref:aminotransferase class IV n=1 Tax=Synechococcus sp. MIT S9451 TaxID=3082543 RepID=UPI0039B46592